MTHDELTALLEAMSANADADLRAARRTLAVKTLIVDALRAGCEDARAHNPPMTGERKRRASGPKS
jgi:hypothetical protein